MSEVYVSENGIGNIENFRAARITAVKALSDTIIRCKAQGANTINISFANTSTYSNVLAPIAGIIEFYEQQGISINCVFPTDSYISKTHVEAPCEIKNYSEAEVKRNPLDKVWKFNTYEEVYLLVHAVVDHIRGTVLLGEGVIESIEWGLNEVLDNVLQHSDGSFGFFMAQIHRINQMFSFCIFDTGRGIYNSLLPSIHHPATPYDALTMAMQERVTRDEKVGQGNGLFGFTQLVRESNGYMRLSSQGATYEFNHGHEREIMLGDFNLGRKNGTTLIDCQICYTNYINVLNALQGYTPTDNWLENIEIGDQEYRFSIAELSTGTGTRLAGNRMRHLILNSIRSDGSRAVIDFDGVAAISSSYADELIGKMIASIGFVKFTQVCSLKNLSPFVASVINRSVQQRMAQIYYGAEVPDE